VYVKWLRAFFNSWTRIKKNATLQRSVPRRCVCANQPIDFVTPNVTAVNLAVTIEFKYDLIMLKEIAVNKLLLFHEHFLIIH
jgi:hypothetical protein